MEGLMAIAKVGERVKNVGFISTRIAGTDGVSLELEKWANIFKKFGWTSYYFAGELDRPPQQSYRVEEAHFTHPEIKAIHDKAFGVSTRDRALSKKIYQLAIHLKDHLYEFVKKFDIDLIIPQNALTIPMNIPLGIAITEFIAETSIPTIAHHHDFYWERDRFMVNAVSDYLRMAFPPVLPSIEHVVINSVADDQLSLRTGISGHVIHNVMDFDNPPPPPDDYTLDVKKALGIEADELFILQPTRVVQRKGIEHAIELVHRLGRKAKLVISHASGDEGWDYEQRLKEYSKLMKVNTVFVDDIINEERGTTPDGRKIYTLEDIYPYADLVTYPSTFEGFGNAFLEALYFKKPIVVNTYSIYIKDIKPKGFKVIEIDGYVTDKAVELTRQVLDNTQLRQEMVDHDYELAKKYFSYTVLQQALRNYMVAHNWLAPGEC
jgi:glycosyltransferase involved in cell wall biosynthesis